MGPSSDEIHQELTETRENVDQRLDLIETRAVSSVRRFLPVMAGGLAAVGVAAGLLLLARSRRQPTLLDRLSGLREGIGVRIPAMRIAIGDRPFADERRSSQWQQIGMRFAESAGAAAGSAALGYAMRRIRAGAGGDRNGEQ
jgi:hypothetical protein